ncbi:unnamed protein product, partial [Polarella glacialis]
AVRLRLQARWRAGAVPCQLHSYDSYREGVALTSLTMMTEPNRWRDTCEEVMQEVLAISSYGFGQEELELAQRMSLDRVEEVARAQPWALMGTLYGYDAAGTSREVVDALIASSPCGHLLTDACSFSAALKKASEEIDLAKLNATTRSLLGHFGGSVGGGPEGARGTIAVTCPSAVHEEHTGRQ